MKKLIVGSCLILVAACLALVIYFYHEKNQTHDITKSYAAAQLNQAVSDKTKIGSGMTVKDSYFYSVSADVAYKAVIYHAKNDDTEGDSLEIYQLGPNLNTGPALIYSFEDALAGGQITFDKLNGKDVTKDGQRKIILDIVLGGTDWTQNYLSVLAIQDGKVLDLAASIRDPYLAQDIQDIKGDGNYQIIAQNIAWQWSFASHADGAGVQAIFSWQDGNYIKNSAAFPEYYEQDMDGYKQELDAAVKTNSVNLPDAVDLFLIYTELNRGQEGWTMYQNYIKHLDKIDPDTLYVLKITSQLKQTYNF